MTIARWKEQLQNASFRGVEFKVATVETVVGRRNVLHEYPSRDVPFVEDLGKKAREFTVNAYCIGDNYIDDLNNLIRVIEQDGSPGILVHPTLGILNVCPKECRITYSNTEGGIEYLTITFIESGINQYPSATTDTQSNAIEKSRQGNEQAEESFADNYAIQGFSDSLATRATNTLIGTSSAQGGDVIFRDNSLYGVLLKVVGRSANLASSSTNYSIFRNNLNNFRDEISTFISSPPEVATRITDLVSGLSTIYEGQPTKIIIAQKQVFNLFGMGIKSIPLTSLANPFPTPNRTQMALNQDQLFDLVHISALIEIIVAITGLEFESRADALKIMFDLQKLMEPSSTSLADNAYDLAYNALNNARIAMVLDIKTRAATLKNVKYIKNYYAVPAIVLAYQQYQDATQEADIITRNRIIKNPLFVPPNKDIEILV